MCMLENICWHLERFKTLLFPKCSQQIESQLKLVTVQQSWMHAAYDGIGIIIWNQRTNGPVNAHLISGPSKAQNIKKTISNINQGP